MTPAQRTKFFAELWPDACQAQGWDEGDRDLRLKVVSEAIGRRVESINDVEKTKEFDLLKARLLLLADSLKGAVEDGDTEPGAKRRLLHHIRTEIRPPRPYLQKILRDRFKVVSEEALDASDLRRLLWLLNRRMNTLRRRSEPQPEKVECPF